ncbi:MAG: glycerol-3-phosphate dehydrogenase [Hyphomicrobiaceae bacterium]
MYDLAIIGGGVNGCGIARDAAGRGLSVLLVEKGDLASGTSSASTKLIHGGLRYLEHYEFRLVSEALSEREVLWSMAPHLIRPRRFVLPYHAGLRARWMIRLGLALYDHLGGRRLLPKSRGLDLVSDPAGAPLKSDFRHGFEYSDCSVDDARLVVLNAIDAARRGADIRVGTEMISASAEADAWLLRLMDVTTGEAVTASARVLVNAAGPWVEDVLSVRIGCTARSHVRLVKGSHIVVPRLFEHDRAYIFQNGDGRVVFAIPYESDFTLIGTTDVEFSSDPAAVAIDEGEVDYLCRAVSAYFVRPVSAADVVWRYSGVRSLYDDGDAAQAVTRDFVLELNALDGNPPLLSVFGGKITTYRRLAEAVLDKLRPWLGDGGPKWTRGATLPGGDFPAQGFEALLSELSSAFDFLPPSLLGRLAHAYGTRASELLVGCRAIADLGPCLGADLYAREVEWLMNEEWARTAADVLWRRSKLGLRVTQAEEDALAAWMAERFVSVSRVPSHLG